MTNERIDKLIKKYEDVVIKHYRWLHAHPELSGQERETSAYITEQLKNMGLEPVENVGGYGVTAVIYGHGEGKCVGLRADIDALPITEFTGLPFASQNTGIMHACGHDSHAAMLLGSALVLNELRDTFSGCVKLIFQPAEENSIDCGAKKMIADGVLENPHVDAMIGQHVDAISDTGMISTKEGVLSASSDRFFITLNGYGSHAARPHMGVDTIAVGAQIITALQTIVSRNVNPMDKSVITIGKINGGERYNVLARHTEMEGTCRNHSTEVRDMIEKRMEEIIKGVAQAMGATYSFKYIRGYSPVVNSSEMVKLIHKTVTDLYGTEKANIPCEPTMGGEDFSFFSEKVPSVYFRTGCHKKGTPVFSTHNEHFVVDEACFNIGINVLVTSTLEYLKKAN